MLPSRSWRAGPSRRAALRKFASDMPRTQTEHTVHIELGSAKEVYFLVPWWIRHMPLSKCRHEGPYLAWLYGVFMCESIRLAIRRANKHPAHRRRLQPVACMQTLE